MLRPVFDLQVTVIAYLATTTLAVRAVKRHVARFDVFANKQEFGPGNSGAG